MGSKPDRCPVLANAPTVKSAVTAPAPKVRKSRMGSKPNRCPVLQNAPLP